MTISDFRATVLMILVCSALAGTCAAQGLPATASGRFESFDTNRDGVVSKNEYNSDSLFAVMDGNHNNRVSADELQAILGPQQEGMPSAADRIRLGDLNNDGELTDEELRRSVEMRFQRVDSNQDGQVDLAEMTSGFGRP